MQQLKVKNNINPTKPTSIRTKLHEELKNVKYCSYQPHECNQICLDGYNYCLRHIMEDKTAPYKQCTYTYGTNKRCHLPGLKLDKKENILCSEHTLKTHVNKVRQASRHQPNATQETMLLSLSHYVARARKRNVSSGTQYSDDGQTAAEDNVESKTTKSLDPFVDVDAFAINTSASDVLEYGSDSESDVEASTYATVWHDGQIDSSDNESIDSEQEDTFKHANVFTAEEVTLVTKEKLIKLQSMYIEQFRHLQYVLRERRRKYLQSLRREKDTFCTVHQQQRDTPKELRLYNKLKALNQYQKRLGVDAIMHKKRNELRAKVTAGISVKPPTFTKCAFMEGGVKCGERSLPVARHCRKHILVDPNQVLFRACGRQKADTECPTPVEAIFPDATCRLHMDIPVIRSYSLTRKDSESDFDESGEVPHTDKALNSIVRQPMFGQEYQTQSPECSNWSNFKSEQYSADENTMDLDLRALPDTVFDINDSIRMEPNDDNYATNQLFHVKKETVKPEMYEAKDFADVEMAPISKTDEIS